jgi:hypothetical protein
MSLARISGERVATTGNVTLYTGAGRLSGVLISNDNAAVQDVAFYDGVNTILFIHVHPALAPIYISFTEAGGKLEGIPFTTSLIANKGHADVELSVWYLEY